MEALRRYLETTGTTQTEFAKRVGVTQVTVSNLVNGVHGPSMALLRDLVRETGLSADDLLASDAGNKAVRHG